MTYTGDVAPGGPADLRLLDAVEIRKASVGPMDNNAYLVTCRRTRTQLLVDAAADPDRLLDLVREGDPAARLGTVVTTHRHRDHTGALASVVAVTGAQVAAGAPDADAITESTGAAVTRRLLGGDRVVVGDVTLEVVALRGHTPGSVALVLREPDDATAPDARPGRVHVFTGDSLFPGGVGRTTSADDFASLYTDVTERLFDRFDDETWIYPGHGRDTTLGAERPHLAQWHARGW